MRRVEASRALLAPVEDVWAFVSEPHNFPDWWPGVGGVQPDRRGVAPGARWQVQGDLRATLLRRPQATGTLLVRAVDPGSRIAFHLTDGRLDVELRLDAPAPDRTVATIVVEGPWLIGLRRTLPRQALGRLHALCQTAAQA